MTPSRCLLLLFLFVLLVDAVNLYQACGTAQSDYYYQKDAGPLALAFGDAPYSWRLDSNHSLLFNVCSNSKACDGAMVCIVSNEEVLPFMYSESLFSYHSQEDSLSLMYDNKSPIAHRHFNLEVSCGSSFFTATGGDMDKYWSNEINIQATSFLVCAESWGRA